MRLLLCIVPVSVWAKQSLHAELVWDLFERTPNKPAYIWLTKQTDLTLLTLDLPEGERKNAAMKYFAARVSGLLTSDSYSEREIHRIAILMEQARYERDQFPLMSYHEMWVLNLALKFWKEVGIDLFGNVDGLIPESEERQAAFRKLVHAFHAYGISMNFEEYAVGTCTSQADLIDKTIRGRSTEELIEFTNGLEIVKSNTDSIAVETGVDVKSSYAPNALVSLYCTPDLEDNIARIREIVSLVDSSSVRDRALEWGRVLRVLPRNLHPVMSDQVSLKKLTHTLPTLLLDAGDNPLEIYSVVRMIANRIEMEPQEFPELVLSGAIVRITSLLSFRFQDNHIINVILGVIPQMSESQQQWLANTLENFTVSGSSLAPEELGCLIVKYTGVNIMASLGASEASRRKCLNLIHGPMIADEELTSLVSDDSVSHQRIMQLTLAYQQYQKRPGHVAAGFLPMDLYSTLRYRYISLEHFFETKGGLAAWRSAPALPDLPKVTSKADPAYKFSHLTKKFERLYRKHAVTLLGRLRSTGSPTGILDIIPKLLRQTYLMAVSAELLGKVPKTFPAVLDEIHDAISLLIDAFKVLSKCYMDDFRFLATTLHGLATELELHIGFGGRINLNGNVIADRVGEHSPAVRAFARIQYKHVGATELRDNVHSISTYLEELLDRHYL